MTMHKVFLSYSHLDDEPYGPRELRWVGLFENALRESIGLRIGPGRVELWRDKRRLTGNQLFDPEIEQQLNESAVLVTVLSQHYIGSAYCKKEFQFFGQRKLAHGDLHVNRWSRIVKVYRRAIERTDLQRFAEQPDLVKEVDGNIGFELFYKDDNGVDRDVLLDPDKMMLYWQRADDIALAIQQIVETQAPVAAAPAAGAEPAPTIYLARTASDMRDHRDALRRELEDRGYTVLPGGELPEEAQQYKQAVRAELQRSRMSVHLIGARFGTILEGDSKSGVVLQAELALEEQRQPFTTIFWSPADLAPAAITEPAQRAFVDRLEGLSVDAGRAEFVRSPLEQLKALVLSRGANIDAKAAAPPAVSRRLVYLICDPADRADARPLKDALESLGFEVARLSLEGTAEELLDEHKLNLVACDAAVVVWGKSREAWVRSKLRDMSQAPGWGRTQPFHARIVVVGPPDGLAKQDFDAPTGVVLLPAASIADGLGALLR